MLYPRFIQYYKWSIFMEKILEEVKDYADKAHGEQLRKYTPDRYIVHPIRVMLICQEYTDDNTILSAALLHDVLEDTPVQKEELKEFLITVMSPEQAITTLKYVVELTDVFTKDDYPALNRKKRKAKEIERLGKVSREAQTIKYADIIDNSIEIGDQDTSFASVFLSECLEILNRIPEGNSELYQRAIKTVEEALKKSKRNKQIS